MKWIISFLSILLNAYYVPNVFDFQKKDPIPKWTIYKYESDKNKKCLYVGNFGILPVVVLYLLKIPYFIHDNSNVAGFLIFEIHC